MAIIEREIIARHAYIHRNHEEQPANGETIGSSTAITLRRDQRGLPSVSVSVQHRLVGQHPGSKKFYSYWKTKLSTSLTVLGDHLLLKRHITDKGITSSWVETPTHEIVRGLITNTSAAMRVRTYNHTDPDSLTTENIIDNMAYELNNNENIITRITEHLHSALPEGRTSFGSTDRLSMLLGDTSTAGNTEMFRRNREAQHYTAGVKRLYLDATNWAEVARNAFGKRAYRKSMVAAIEKLEPHALLAFTQFRGLVPIEWIIDAMRQWGDQHTTQINTPHMAVLRETLRMLPEPVLRRILKQNLNATLRSVSDLAHAARNPVTELRNLRMLSELVRVRGQKNIRSMADVEHLISQVPVDIKPYNKRSFAARKVQSDTAYLARELNDYNNDIVNLPEADRPEPLTWEQWKDPAIREAAGALLQRTREARMAERERVAAERREQRRLEQIANDAERAAWATELTAQLQGIVVPENVAGHHNYTVTVASAPEQLTTWGVEMGHCIGSYTHRIGLDVFIAVHDTTSNTVVLNAQITHRGTEEGLEMPRYTGRIEQILGKHNRTMDKALGGAAQATLDWLQVEFKLLADTAWGVENLAAGKERLEALEVLQLQRTKALAA